MKILFTGRKTRPNRALKTFIEEKLAKLDRVLDVALDAHVTLTLEKHRCLAEVLVKARTATLTARAEARSFQEAVILCIDRLHARAKKHHDRLRERGKRGASRAARWQGVPALGEVPRGGDRRLSARAVRMSRISAKPMSVEEALHQVRGSLDPFVVFLNAESQQIAVLYRRPDGRFHLFEAEA
jgi:putative sigma-54 modulation protein